LTVIPSSTRPHLFFADARFRGPPPEVPGFFFAVVVPGAVLRAGAFFAAAFFRAGAFFAAAFFRAGAFFAAAFFRAGAFFAAAFFRAGAFFAAAFFRAGAFFAAAFFRVGAFFAAAIATYPFAGRRPSYREASVGSECLPSGS
jgi:hypothetical protein